jgi:iron complex transport system permease protein
MLAVPLLLAGLAAVLALVGAGMGDYPLSPAQVLAVLSGGGDDAQRVVVWELRLPRVVTGLLVGLALGASGAVTQSVARNPLASPDVLGITAGASAGAVAVIAATGAGIGGVSLRPAGGLVPAAALAGGVAAAAAVYLLAWRRGIDGMRLVLVGIGMWALLGAVTSWLLVATSITDASRATLWLTGSLAASTWEVVVPLAVTVVVAGALAAVAAFPLRALRLGDDSARSLGVRVQPARAGLVLVAVALAAMAVAAAGPIAFVALAAPQVAMRLMRSPGPPVVAGAMMGAVLMLAADLAARVVLPAELPVGIVTAVLGAPFLLYLLARRTRGVAT